MCGCCCRWVNLLTSIVCDKKEKESVNDGRASLIDKESLKFMKFTTKCLHEYLLSTRHMKRAHRRLLVYIFFKKIRDR